MPGSARTFDTTTQRLNPLKSLPLPPEEAVIRSAKNHSGTPIQLPPSPSESDPTMNEVSPRGSISAIPPEESRIIRNLDRGAPGDQAIFSEAKTDEQRDLARRKSNFYGEAFAFRESISSARERVLRESPVFADIKTNVIVGDEYTFITDLSHTLSTRFQRPENSIVVTLAHSCCLLFGGTFDPAYTLTIHALPSQLQPVTNKRNAALLARAMEEGLGVGPERGLIKFCAVAEENLATDGKTMAAEIEELEKETSESHPDRKMSRSVVRDKRRPSMPSWRSKSHQDDSLTTPPLSDADTPPMPTLHTEMTTAEFNAHMANQAARPQVGRQKSFVAAMFGKSG